MHCKNNKASRYVIETSKFFVKENEVHVFTNDNDPIDERVILHKIPVLSLTPSLKELSFTLIGSIFLKKQAFDIRLSQPTRFFSPNVCEMQVVYKQWAKIMTEKDSFSLRLVLMMEKYNIKKAKKIITISEKVKKDILINYPFVDENIIDVVYSGVDLDKFHPKNKKKYFEQIRKRHNIPLNNKVILFVGNPFILKGLECAIKSISKINKKNINLLVCGRDDITPYQNLIKKNNLDKKVIFAGFRSDIEKYFAASDIFVFPTKYDAFGLVALEAMASGLPVISSIEAGVTEIIDNGNDGFILNDPCDYDKMSEKIKLLIKYKSLYKKISRNARKKSEKFSWELTAKKMLSTFKNVIS